MSDDPHGSGDRQPTQSNPSQGGFQPGQGGKPGNDQPDQGERDWEDERQRRRDGGSIEEQQEFPGEREDEPPQM